MQKSPFIDIDGKLINIEHIVLIKPFENKKSNWYTIRFRKFL